MITTVFAFAMALGLQQPAPAQQTGQQGAQQPAQDLIVTGGTTIRPDGSDDTRYREAIAYALPLPAGVPEDDYGLVSWCHGIVMGHVRLGESLGTLSADDQDFMRIARLEATDFAGALASARGRQSPESLASAEAASERARAFWAPYMAQETAEERRNTFDLFFGLPGRCEHAARRLRRNITTPPATLAEVGIDEAAFRESLPPQSSPPQSSQPQSSQPQSAE